MKQLKAGANFEQLVEKYSEDSTSRANKGDFAVLKYGDSFSEDMRKAVMALKPGEILSEPLRQPAAFYIIRLAEKTIQPLSEVREPIIAEIKKMKLNEWFGTLTKRFKLEVVKPEFFTKPVVKP
jgi:parvulin-like peptidyl-prolyl isomerase